MLVYVVGILVLLVLLRAVFALLFSPLTWILLLLGGVFGGLRWFVLPFGFHHPHRPFMHRGFGRGCRPWF